jgi:hypothetical protein
LLATTIGTCVSSRRFILSLSTVLISLTGSTATARAAITFRADYLVVDSGALPATVAVEIFIDPGMPPWPNVTAFQVRGYLLDGLGSGITIGSTGRPQTHTYLRPSSQPVVSVVGNRIDAGDISFTGSTPLFAEAGLLRVELVIPLGVPAGFYKLDIEDDPQFSFIADSNGLNIPINAAFGGVQIVDVVPGDYDRNQILNEADYQFWRSKFGDTAAPDGSGADGNRDGIVDSADYVVWRKFVMPIHGDYNSDGRVDAADYIVWRKTDGSHAGNNLWRTHFGESLSSGGAVGDSGKRAAIPEPANSLLLVCATGGFLRRRSDYQRVSHVIRA